MKVTHLRYHQVRWIGRPAICGQWHVYDTIWAGASRRGRRICRRCLHRLDQERKGKYEHPVPLR